MRHIIAALLVLAALPLPAAPAAAQGILPFTVEARAGVAVPVDDFAASAEAGYLIEATAKLSPLPFVTVYGGWTLADFEADSDAGIAGLDTNIRDSGFRLGGELAVPLAGLMSGVAPYFLAGLIFNRADVRVAGDGTNTLSARADRKRGFELGTGARVMIGRRLSVLPEVRYRSYEPEFATEPSIGIASKVSYVAASLALTLHF